MKSLTKRLTLFIIICKDPNPSSLGGKMEKNPLEKIEEKLHHAKTVLLITDGKEKPQKKAINLLRKEVSFLTTVSSTNRSTKTKMTKNSFDLILGHRGGYFIPHPNHSTV
ncbi:MAG: hypothetical protein PF572_01700 [Patescibacteria group bacterium]|jgi:hypothetical protein|nr:hypothetical protein [Patescibacteria group bacterium]